VAGRPAPYRKLHLARLSVKVAIDRVQICQQAGP
jgi:hypothetical protein